MKTANHAGERHATCLSCNWAGWVRPSGDSGNICPKCGCKVIVGKPRYENYDADLMGNSNDKKGESNG